MSKDSNLKTALVAGNMPAAVMAFVSGAYLVIEVDVNGRKICLRAERLKLETTWPKICGAFTNAVKSFNEEEGVKNSERVFLGLLMTYLPSDIMMVGTSIKQGKEDETSASKS